MTPTPQSSLRSALRSRGQETLGAALRFPESPRADDGFTLLEITVVLFLAGIMMALAVPALNAGSAGLEMKAAARQVGAGLRKARAVAVGERREAVLTLDLAAHTFEVSGDPKVYALPAGVELKLFTATSEALDDTHGSIRFYADGSSTGGRITLGRGESQQEVDVDWLTGRVKVL